MRVCSKTAGNESNVAGARQSFGRKYRNIKVTVDGHKFDSKKEARRYQQLQLLLRAKAIRNLELQPKFEIHAFPNGEKVGFYRADFRYFDVERDMAVIEDVKSEPTKTPVYRLKKKLVEAEHGIRIMEV